MAACAITTAPIALAVVGPRLYTRCSLTAARFQIGGAFVCCAAVCSIMLIPISFPSLFPSDVYMAMGDGGLTVLSIVMQAGVGLHMWDVTMAQYPPGLGIAMDPRSDNLPRIGRDALEPSILAFYCASCSSHGSARSLSPSWESQPATSPSTPSSSHSAATQSPETRSSQSPQAPASTPTQP
ncbi:hypothetical protein BDV10DRAFT_185450 [Aspergillus recurvatus]